MIAVELSGKGAGGRQQVEIRGDGGAGRKRHDGRSRTVRHVSVAGRDQGVCSGRGAERVRAGSACHRAGHGISVQDPVGIEQYRGIGNACAIAEHGAGNRLAESRVRDGKWGGDRGEAVRRTGDAKAIAPHQRLSKTGGREGERRGNGFQRQVRVAGQTDVRDPADRGSLVVGQPEALHQRLVRVDGIVRIDIEERVNHHGLVGAGEALHPHADGAGIAVGSR